MNNRVKNSVSPLSGYSVSPSQSVSPLSELNRFNKNLGHHHFNNHNQSLNLQENSSYQSRQQLERNQEINQLLNDSSQSSGHFDIQSELESLLVNTTLSDGTLASNMSNNDDNSNNSAKYTSLTNDDLCDIDMNFDTNFSQAEYPSNELNTGNTFTSINDKQQQLEPIAEKSYMSQPKTFNILNMKPQSLKSSASTSNTTFGRAATKYFSNKSLESEGANNKVDLFSSSQKNNLEVKQQKTNSSDANACDPVLTQIALSTSNLLAEAQAKSNNLNSGNNSNTYLLTNKRNLFNQNNNDDLYLPSINVSNLNVQNNAENQSHQTLNFSSQSLNFLNQSCDINTMESNDKARNFNLNLGFGVNILKTNNNNMQDSMNSYGPYSMSLPANYSNFMEFASSTGGEQFTSHLNKQSLQGIQQSSSTVNNNNNTNNSFNSEDIENACRIDDTSSSNMNNSNNNNNNDLNISPNSSSNMINSLSNDNYLMPSSGNYGCLSMSLPAYTADMHMMKYKQQQQQQANQSQVNPFHTNLLQNSSNLKSNSNRADNISSPHLNKLLLSNTKVLSSFNSDSNLSCTNTVVSSLASITSPLSNVQDDFDNASSLSNSNLNSLSNILQDDDFDEQDSDDESINNDAFFDLMNKNRDTYFWQYNIQSKGPKTKKVLTLRNKDPHLHRDFFDPVYQLQTINSRGIIKILFFSNRISF